MDNKPPHQIIFSDIYCEKNKPLIAQAARLLNKNSEQIVNNFYIMLNTHEEMIAFLPNEDVKQRLKQSMQRWLLSIFDFDDNHDFTIFVEKQEAVGKVHARIRIPMIYVNVGIDHIKQQIVSIVFNEKINSKENVALIHLIHRTIDLAAMIFNNVYFNHSIKQEKNEQGLRHHYANHNLAIEFEQSRADLLHWHSDLISALYYPYSRLRYSHITALRQSKFGLWIDHRATLLFDNPSEMKKFQDKLNQIDSMLEQVIMLNQKKNWEKLAEEVDVLNSLVTSTDWLLSQVAKDIEALENNKDPLTRLFTRRYLPNIIQHEIRYCLEHDVQLGIIMLDLDHFKQINDRYGHSVGDTILSQTAALLSASIRAYDYIFRYGGEEFLIIINNTDQSQCLSIAEEIRRKVEIHQHHDLPSFQDAVTVSMGVAIFDKHPDYEQLINHADQALYLAKEKGRNRVELYRPS